MVDIRRDTMEQQDNLLKEWKTYCCKMVSADEVPKGFKEWIQEREEPKRTEESGGNAK